MWTWGKGRGRERGGLRLLTGEMAYSWIRGGGKWRSWFGEECMMSRGVAGDFALLISQRAKR